MFDKDNNVAVGAREKQRRAQALKGGKASDMIHASRGGGVDHRPMVTVLCILIMAVGLAYFLSVGPWEKGVPFETGINAIDRNLLSATRPNFMGDATIDFGILVFLRGFLLFLAAGFLPLAGLTWMRLIDRPEMSPWRTVWGVGIGIAFAYYVIMDAIWPLLKDLFGIT